MIDRLTTSDLSVTFSPELEAELAARRAAAVVKVALIERAFGIAPPSP